MNNTYFIITYYFMICMFTVNTKYNIILLKKYFSMSVIIQILYDFFFDT